MKFDISATDFFRQFCMNSISYEFVYNVAAFLYIMAVYRGGFQELLTDVGTSWQAALNFLSAT